MSATSTAKFERRENWLLILINKLKQTFSQVQLLTHILEMKTPPKSLYFGGFSRSFVTGEVNSQGRNFSFISGIFLFANTFIFQGL